MAHLVSTDREQLLAYGRHVGLPVERLQFKPLKAPARRLALGPRWPVPAASPLGPHLSWQAVTRARKSPPSPGGHEVPSNVSSSITSARSHASSLSR